MVKSESEIKKMTKTQLKQWLSKHDQRLPVQEKLKKYYLERAIKYFHLLQKETSSNRNKNKNKNNNSNNITQRSRSKKKKPIISKSRTLKKTNPSHSNSLTPKKKKNYVSTSPSLSRSKKRIIRVRRKTPSKQSPSIIRSLKKKRDKMRRATADPHNLSQLQLQTESENESENESDDVDINIRNIHERESENGGDYYNSNPSKYILDNDPETMTISRLQHWLDENNINFLQGRKKQTYVDLVKRYSSKKRNLSPKHKHAYSPNLKKSKTNTITPVGRRKRHQSYAGAPLPSNLRKSPLTPQDDEKSHGKSRRKRKTCDHLLSTPALNKTGVSRIDTPSKAQMRDEIRNLLELDANGDTDPLYPVSTDNTDETPGITPGGPSSYDPGVLNNVLSDLRKQKDKQAPKPRRKSMEPVHVFNPKDVCDAKTDGKPSESFFNSIIAKFSPHRVTSPHSMHNQVSNVLASNNTKKKHKNSYVAKRTLPSPVTPQEFNDINDDDNKVDNMTPITNYQQELQLNDSGNSASVYYDDEPMSPAITQCHIHQNKIENNVRRSTRVQNKKKGKKTPPKPKKKCETPAIIPSIPSFQNMKKNQNLSPHKLPFEKNENEVKKVSTRSRCKAVIKILFLALFGAAIACFFAVFDGMDVINDRMDLLSDILNNYGAEEVIYFCDSGKTTVGENEGECRRCPSDASFCSNGEAMCKTNYILQDDKCVLDGVVVKIAYNLKKQIHEMLADKRGKYECFEDDVDGYVMTSDELLANLAVFDESKKDEAFAYFNEYIVPESSQIKVNGKGEYYSYKSSKSAVCKIKEWALTNLLGIITTFIVAVIVFSIWCKYKRKKWEKKEIDAMVGNIYNILDEFERFNKQRYVPIDVIKQRIKPKSNKLWKCVDDLIQKDINIQKSIRMIDGMQKRCLALSSMQSCINNNPYNYNGQRSQSQRPQSQQSQSQQPPSQQWNFNKNNNYNDADGFNFERSNQMAHPNNFDNNKHSRFPPHSKRSMF